MVKYDKPSYTGNFEDQVDYVKPALLVVDMQKAYLESAPGEYTQEIATMIARSRDMVDAFRAHGWPVIFTCFESNNHCKNLNRRHYPNHRDLDEGGKRLCFAGTRGIECVDELKPLEGELQFNKLGYDAFYGTCLEYCLRTQGIKTLVIVGILTDMCIASTVSTAFHYEYGVVVPSDCTRAFTPARTDAYLICFDEAYGAVRPSNEVIELLERANK